MEFPWALAIIKGMFSEGSKKLKGDSVVNEWLKESVDWELFE